jgi:hypothetical protein
MKVRIRLWLGGVGKRLWRPRSLFVAAAWLIYAAWFEEPLLGFIRRTGDERGRGALRSVVRFFLENPTLIPVSIVALAVLVLLVRAYADTRPKEDRSGELNSVEDLFGRAAILVEELVWFIREQREGLPPLSVIRGGQLEAWQNTRDDNVMREYRRIFGERVRATYEELRARRGYDHPLMVGRYDNVRTPLEVFTVTRALGQMIG